MFSAMKTNNLTFKELSTLLQLMFTLTSVLFLHNKWQQNEHYTHLYDSSLWKYTTHQTCFAMYQSTKNIYNCNCENREKRQLKHKSPFCCICAWKSAYCVRTKERGGHQMEWGTTESDGYLYSVGEILIKHKGNRDKTQQCTVWSVVKWKLLAGASQHRQNENELNA